MTTRWDHAPDFANSVQDEPDLLLGAKVGDAIRKFFRDREDDDAVRAIVESVAASVTVQRGRAHTKLTTAPSCSIGFGLSSPNGTS